MGKTGIYELLVLIHPEETVEKVVLSVENLIKKYKGKIVKTDDWGKRVLAYPIKKQTEGDYVLFTIEIGNEQVKPLGEALKIKDEILRHMITKVQSSKLKVQS